MKKELKNPEIFKPNDHRLLNKDLKFFMFLEEIGSSLPIWLPNGETFKHLLKTYLRKLEEKHGFIFVTTPVLASQKIYQKSGHLAHYEEFMFPAMNVSEQKFRLRPMTCPHHCLIFKKQNYSYNDLPIRISENSFLFRYERSGAIHGLERVRQMELKDSHIFLPKNEMLISKEIKNIFEMTKTFLNTLGLNNLKIYLSLHDAKDKTKYFNDSDLWKNTENILENSLKEINVEFEKMVGEAAFYGPKIDFQFQTDLGHDVTVSTIQLDFVLANKFKLKYRTNFQEKEKQFDSPILIHHGIIGTYERLLALLLEHHKGWLPFWLTPVQAMLFVVNFNDPEIKNYYQKVVTFLKSFDIRLKVMDMNKHLNENLRSAWKEKIPLHIFIGNQELKENKVTYQFVKETKNKNKSDLYQLIHLIKEKNQIINHKK